MKIPVVIILLFQLNIPAAQGQKDTGSQEVPFSVTNNKKVLAATGVSIAGYAGSLYLLNKAWYANYPKSSFHTINDNREWLQMDKVGHVWTAYQTSRALSTAWRWTGMKENKAVWIGTLSGFSYMTVIEFLDAHSAGWGWSWGDITANFIGASLFASQQLTWKEQKILIKFSAHRNAYSSELIDRANDLYGNNLSQRLLKDYNAQTYWLSINLKAMLPGKKLPEWLNIAIGYGANGMFGASENTGYDKNGQLVFDRRDINRYRQWYLSPDIDFTKLKTKSKVLKTIFFLLNSVKIPAPTIGYSGGVIKGHWLLF